jgi:hypothetical protein
MGQITVKSLDKVTLARAVGMLGKAFVVCSPAELRAVNGSISLVVPVKVPGATSPRYVTTQLLADVDGVARLLCRGSALASTRTCVVELTAPTPASSASP